MTLRAGVVGQPIRHSLSPLIHAAWLRAAGIDGTYEAFEVPAGTLARFVEGRVGGLVGLNVTLPLKEEALALAHEASARAIAAGAANLLIFQQNGTILANNTDGLGLMAAFAAQSPGFDAASGPVVVLGAGGAARGAAATLSALAPSVRVVNRTLAKAEALRDQIGGPVEAWPLAEAARAFEGAVAVVNATSAGLSGEGSLDLPLEALPADCVVMDMVYKPLETELLRLARARKLRTVDGLEMLIGQARPSFEAFYGQPPPDLDVRALALKALGG